HGKVRLTLEKDLDRARQDFENLADLGISIDQVTLELEDEGVAAFAEAFMELLKTVEERRKSAVEELGPLVDGVASQVKKLANEKIPSRLRANDPTIWTDEPAGRHEIRKRLGWLTLPEKSRDLLPELLYYTEEARAAGYTHALLLGMGGSSLAPEVFRTVFGVAPGFLNLAILDSTDPAQVVAADRRSKIDNTLYIISSKSGATAEVQALLNYFWKRATDVAGNHAAEHFIVITDPGTSLEELAREREFCRIFLADPKVGGRYSALSAFGLVPASLIGMNVASLLEHAARMEHQCIPDVPAGRNPGLVLGAIIGEAARQGRDKLTFLTGPALSPFCDWLSQLIAESSGKQGVGIVPVEGETLASPDVYGEDRLFVYLRRASDIRTKSLDQAAERLKRAGHPVIALSVEDNDDFGAEFYRWELATAVACAVLGVNAFDQPDVQESKDRTLAIIDKYYKTRKLDEGQVLWQGEGIKIYGSQLTDRSDGLPGILHGFLGQGQPGDYVAINAYLPHNQNIDGMLHKLRISILDHTHLATTIGYGPRYLHSIGQLHKGGKNNVLFIEITADPEKDVDIPGEGLTFGKLERAQAVADLDTLLDRGRRALRIHLSDTGKLQTVLEAIG
ncbi:MAG: transaldolase, partial [Omnitrophica WOR_2 bacterium]